MINYGKFVDLKGADLWLKKNVDWIKDKLPTIPPTEVEMEVLDEDNILSGRTRIEKKKNVRVKITIFVSKNVLTRKNIQQAIKAVLIHEFCHVVSPLDPDKVMETYFPQVWEIWRKAQDSKALNCDISISEAKRGG